MTTRFAAAVSEHPLAATAVGEVVGQVLEGIGPAPDLACCFVAQSHTSSMQAIAGAIRKLLGPRTLLLCSTSSVVGGPQEVEDRAAIALFAGHTGLCTPVRLEASPTLDGWEVRGVPEGVDRDEPRVLLLCADPASFPAEQLFQAFASDWPAVTIVGGLASTSPGAPATRLGLDDERFVDGAVGVLLPADLPMRAVVSQGCRPIGDPFTVTSTRDNIVLELGGQPAMTRLDQLVERATPPERALLAGGVHLGMVIDERRDAFERGDFLVRSIVGAERATGGIAIAGTAELGTTVQFHVRDASTADEDLRFALAGPPADAALLFTCIARGARLFGDTDHDAREVHDAVGRGAVAGMFCDGEFGPVGLRSFVHGYTASVLLFGSAEDPRSATPRLG